MNTLELLLQNFFTHKDFLPPPEQWYGTLFTPMQILFCAVVAVVSGVSALLCARREEGFQKKVFFWLWLIFLASEPVLMHWEATAGQTVGVHWDADLPLWPCSLYLYAAPVAIFGKGNWRKAACGYICTLGLVGGLINFVYPANYLSRYSCLSFPGVRTILYHGNLVFTAVTMLLSGYHSFRGATRWQQLLLPAMPVLIMSIPANILNFTCPGADYMFFKLESFFFAPIGLATPDWFTVILVYLLYILFHMAPYYPDYRKSRGQKAVL